MKIKSNTTNTPEIKSLKQEISSAIEKYGSNHVSLLQTEEKDYFIMYHSSNNSFSVNDKSYRLEGISKDEIERLCEDYDISFEEE